MTVIDKALSIIALSECCYLAITRIVCTHGTKPSLADVLPFVPGHTVAYNIVAMVIVAIAIWGIFRTRR